MRLTLAARRAGGRGQALVELAFALPIFLALVLSIVVFALYLFYNQQLANAAREAARYAATHSSTAQCPTVSRLDPPDSLRSSGYFRCDAPEAGWPRMTAAARAKVWGMNPAGAGSTTTAACGSCRSASTTAPPTWRPARPPAPSRASSRQGASLTRAVTARWRPSYHVRAMARDASPRMRCRRCGMHRLDDARECVACGADLSLPGALEPAGPPAGRLGASRPVTTQARRLDDIATRRATLQSRRGDAAPAPRRPEPASWAPRRDAGPVRDAIDDLAWTGDGADADAAGRTTGRTASSAPGGGALGQGASARVAAQTRATALRRGSTPTDLPAGGARVAGTAPVGPAPVRRVSRLWWALDDKSRRTVIRLGVELVLLVVVVAAVWTNTLGRSRPAATGAPPTTPAGASATAPALGITSTDITTVFELPYAGGFEFQPTGAGADARLEGASQDGIATISLYGPRSDLTKAVLTIHVTADHEVDPVGRQLMAVFLILYCPGALDQLQATLADAIATGRDLAVGASWNGIEARLETHLQPGGRVTITLLPVTAPTPTPAATPTRTTAPSAAPTTPPATVRPSGASPSPARSASPVPSATPRTTPRPS